MYKTLCFWQNYHPYESTVEIKHKECPLSEKSNQKKLVLDSFFFIRIKAQL